MCYLLCIMHCVLFTVLSNIGGGGDPRANQWGIKGRAEERHGFECVLWLWCVRLSVEIGRAHV